MDSRNEFVRRAYFRFCNWGQRTTVKLELPYKGGPTPLWGNFSVSWFENLGAVSAVFLIVCLLEYILIEQ